MTNKPDKSITLWMLKDTNTNSFVAMDPMFYSMGSKCFPYMLCPYYEICEYEMVAATNKIGVEDVAGHWNKAYPQYKVKPIKVRVTLEFLSKGANNEN